MDDAFGMGGIEGGGQAGKDARRFLDRKRPLLEAVGQRAAGHETHHEVRLAILLAEVIDRHNDRVFEHGDRLGLTLEAGAELQIVEHLARQDLDGHLALEARVVGAVDCCHAAPSQFSPDFVATDLFWIHDAILTSFGACGAYGFLDTTLKL